MKLKSYKILLGLASLLLTLVSCSEMDEYKQYMPEGEIRYVGRADSTTAYSGKNRILLSWLLISDPNIIRCKVYWDNKGDSIEIPVEKSAGIDTIYLLLDNMEERTYNFEIYTYDNEGNRSVPVFESGAAYGDKYQAVLLPRLINEAWFIKGDTAVLTLGAPGSDLLGTELEYTSESGQAAELIVPPEQNEIKITDYQPGTSFRYRTLYLPDSLSIDTFYTDFIEEELLYEIDRSAWTVSGFSSEEASGEGEDNGHAIHAIDNDIGTFWHTQWEGTQPEPPHYISFDMGGIETIHGLYFEPRQGSTTGNARDIQVAVSLNGNSWTDAGSFTLPNDDSRHVIDLPSAVETRYVKVTVNASHGDQASTFFAEVGAF